MFIFSCVALFSLLRVCLFFSGMFSVASVAVNFNFLGACISGPENGPAVLYFQHGVPADGPGIGTIFLDCLVFLGACFWGCVVCCVVLWVLSCWVGHLFIFRGL
jgi:hypothetical protein